MTRETEIPAADGLYRLFSRYSYSGRKFCDFCYAPAEWKEISRTPVRHLSVEHGRKLLWEASDHWESGDVYRHYLPRLLELLGPPSRVEDLYPLHLFEILIAMGFRRWSDEERNAVTDYLERIGPEIMSSFDEADQKEWLTGVAALKDPLLALPQPPPSQR